jgi:hypothetical protein
MQTIAVSSQPDTLPPDGIARQIWYDAVRAVATKATAALPDCHDRIDKAVGIVLAGDVAMQADGTALVPSQSHPETVYVVNGGCTCLYAQHHSAEGNCVHRLAKWLHIRATALARHHMQALDQSVAPPPPAPVQYTPQVCTLPEAPASANVYIEMAGRKVQVTLRDTDEQRLLQRMAVILAQYPAPPAQLQQY